MITTLDLFSGIGGWSLACHSAGLRTLAACEIDEFKRSVYAHHFPRVRLYDDVRKLSADRLRRDLGRLPDWIVGSPPCQDASTANSKGKGVDGERTGLFFEAIRLVDECRPLFVCFENVPGLRARGADRVLAALEGCGYAVEALVVGARHVGAPHKRDRVWIVGRREAAGQPAREQVGSAGQSRVGSSAPASDLPGIGRGQGRPGRPDPGRAGQSEQAFQDAAYANEIGREGARSARSSSDLRRRSANADDAVATDAIEDGRGAASVPSVEGWRSGQGCAAGGSGWLVARGPEGQDRDAPNPDGHALRQQPGRGSGQNGPGVAEPGHAGQDASHAHGAGLPLRPCQPGDARPEQPTAFRDHREAWAGGPEATIRAAHAAADRVDDGISGRTLRRGIAAYGDAIVPEVGAAVIRAILAAEAQMQEAA